MILELSIFFILCIEYSFWVREIMCDAHWTVQQRTVQSVGICIRFHHTPKDLIMKKIERARADATDEVNIFLAGEKGN